MSEEAGFGIALAERFFGLLLILIGALAVYFTFTSMNALGMFTGLFGFLSFVLLILGIILVTARIE